MEEAQLNFGSYILLGVIVVFLGRHYISTLLRGLADIFNGERKEKVPVKKLDPNLPLGELKEAYSKMDERRRNILKLFVLGGGAFFVGKIVGPSIRLFPTDFEDGTTFFKNFRVVEKGNELGFYDRMGNQILILEEDLFKSKNG